MSNRHHRAQDSVEPIIRENAAKIHDIAAHAFWLFAARYGVRDTISIVESESAASLYAFSEVDAYVRGALVNLPPDLLPPFVDAVSAEIDEHVASGRQLTGMIFGEDAESGRSPSAKPILTDQLSVLPTTIERSPRIERIGSLCIRAPLPAVVFAEEEPENAFIEVADTHLALGFPFPLFLQVHAVSPGVPSHPYILRGVFSIPVPTAEHGDRWRSVIQNFTGFTEEINIAGASAPTFVRVSWPHL